MEHINSIKLEFQVIYRTFELNMIMWNNKLHIIVKIKITNRKELNQKKKN